MPKAKTSKSGRFGIRPMAEGVKPSTRGVKPTQGGSNPKPPRGGTGQSNKVK